MMKTTIATVAVAALATTAAAAPVIYSTATTQLDFIAIDECKPAAGFSSIFGATPYGTNFVRLDGEADAVKACVDKITGTAVTTADKCFVTTGDAPAEITTFVPGADKICPVASGSTCKKAAAPAAADFCQAKDAATEVACTADKCAWIAPAKALQVNAKFKQWYKDPASQQKDVPQPIIDAQIKAAKDCGIKAPATAFPTDAKGRSVTSIQACNANCDPAAYKKTVQDAIDAWNKDAANKEKQFTPTGETGEVKLVDVPTACYDAVDNKFLCATTKDCAWKCADETVCEADSVCGSGKCQAPAAAFVAQQAATKKCWSNAVASVVAPVIAAAVAIAFF